MTYFDFFMSIVTPFVSTDDERLGCAFLLTS